MHDVYKFLENIQTCFFKYFYFSALLFVSCFQIRNRTKLGGKKDSHRTSEDKRKLVIRKTIMHRLPKSPFNKRLSL